MRHHHPRRNAHQDTMADPFEIGDTGWEAWDTMADDFTWATTCPAESLRGKRHGKITSR
jgi:hypothetical protein